MRWFYLTVIILFAAAAIIFALQNLGTVTVSFLSFSASMRLAFLVSIIYLLGPRREAACSPFCADLTKDRIGGRKGILGLTISDETTNAGARSFQYLSGAKFLPRSNARSSFFAGA